MIRATLLRIVRFVEHCAAQPAVRIVGGAPAARLFLFLEHRVRLPHEPQTRFQKGNPVNLILALAATLAIGVLVGHIFSDSAARVALARDLTTIAAWLIAPIPQSSWRDSITGRRDYQPRHAKPEPPPVPIADDNAAQPEQVVLT